MNGTYLHLETPEHGVIVQDGRIVNQEAWDLVQERRQQSRKAPKKPQATNNSHVVSKKENEAVTKRMDTLEAKLDKIADALTKITDGK